MTRQRLLTIALAAMIGLFGLLAGYSIVQARSEAVLRAVHPQAQSDIRAASAPEDIAAGRHLATVAGCAICHGRGMAGPSPGAFIADHLQSPNLTRIVGQRSDAQLDRAIRQGLNPDGTSELAMPAYAYASLTNQQTAQIIGYLRSLAPVGEVVTPPPPSLALRMNLATGGVKPQVERLATAKPAMDLGAAHQTGRQLAVVACGQCHGSDLAGGRALPGPDLTVRGFYDRKQFHALMQDGEVLQGTSELMQKAARSSFSHFSPAEVDAIYDYLLARDLVLAKAKPAGS